MPTNPSSGWSERKRGGWFTLTCLACLAGVCTGLLGVDGTFINFRGEEVRRAIEKLADGTT